MQNVKKVELLPRMIKQVNIEDLQTYFLDLAKELMADISD